eukprot:1157916-Pelagomonas_calceolata.AAC.8
MPRHTSGRPAVAREARRVREERKTSSRRCVKLSCLQGNGVRAFERVNREHWKLCRQHCLCAKVPRGRKKAGYRCELEKVQQVRKVDRQQTTKNAKNEQECVLSTFLNKDGLLTNYEHKQ